MTGKLDLAAIIDRAKARIICFENAKDWQNPGYADFYREDIPALVEALEASEAKVETLKERALRAVRCGGICLDCKETLAEALRGEGE